MSDIPSTVFFTRQLTPDAVVRMYEALGVALPGKVAVKVHSGEKGNQNFLHPEFMRPMVEAVGGTIVECNTAYPGARNETEKHRKLLDEHGWTNFFRVDLLDAEEPDLELPVSNGRILRKNLVGGGIRAYDSMLVLSHFKGHPMGGFGGALKQLSIGCASSRGKAWIHSAGVTDDQEKVWSHVAKQEDFIDAMAEAASTVVELFRGRIAFVSMMCNLSVDCDCCAVAEDPCMNDIGILSSTDPVALDTACLDMIRQSKDRGRDHFLERVDSRMGARILDTAEALRAGSKRYRLVSLDE